MASLYVQRAKVRTFRLSIKALLSPLLPSVLKKKKKKKEKEPPLTKCTSDLPIPSDLPVPVPNIDCLDKGAPSELQSQPTPNIVTYALSVTDTIDYIDLPLVEAVVKRAFGCYAQAIPVFFLRVEEFLSADVKIGFYSGEHDNCSHPFGPEDLTVAHAWQDGSIHLNAATRWAVDFKKEESSIAIDLGSTLVHEIGHVMGLRHSSLECAVMYPILDYRKTKLEFSDEDVKMLQAIYGSNFNIINKDDWMILTVDAYFDGRRSGGGGFILWDGARELIIAQSSPLSCGSAASARFEACCLGLNFLKTHNFDKVLVLTNCVNIRQMLRFNGDPFKLREWLLCRVSTVKFGNKYREGMQATCQLAKIGRRSKQISQRDQKNWPEPLFGLLNREARMLRHLPLDAFS